MNKAMTILYRVHGCLYVNLTNRCPCSCIFCLRRNRDTVSETDEGSLWLEREPSADEVVLGFDAYDMSQFRELVFCGYGEPTERLDVLLEVARCAKERFGISVRINTNGMANLIWKRDVTPSLEGAIDTVSVSLNNPDPVKYQQIVRSRFGAGSFDAMLDFTSRAVAHVPHVVMTTVATVLTPEEEEKCRGICRKIGAEYRIRPWID